MPLIAVGLAPGAWPFVGIGLLIAVLGLGVILYGRRRNPAQKWTATTISGFAISFVGVLVMSLRRT